MKLEKEDYIDPRCVLCGKPGEEETVQPVPVGRIMDKLREYEDRNDWPAVERHLKYWLAEADANRDERGQLMLHNELMGYYRMRGEGEPARKHAARAVELLEKLGMEDTITAGTTYINSGIYYFHDEDIEWPDGVEKHLSDAFAPQEKTDPYAF